MSDLSIIIINIWCYLLIFLHQSVLTHLISIYCQNSFQTFALLHINANHRAGVTKQQLQPIVGLINVFF